MLRLAASNPWPILIFWGIFALLARAAKKKAPPRQPLARLADADSSSVELGDSFQRAMEKLKQAEREAKPAPVARRRPKPIVVAYDDEAVRLEESRVREEADAFERIAPALSPRLVVSAPAAAPPAVHAPARRNALARFADGSLRGAVVLSEILGRPVADR
ncbi:MAG: hypothetical protein ACHQU8_09260 [Gemmatimonadales bacterium]